MTCLRRSSVKGATAERVPAVRRKCMRRGQVFGVDDADDVFGAAGFVVDGDAGVLVVNDGGAGGLDEGVGGEGDDFLPGRHDFADGDFFHLEGAVDEVFLKGGGGRRCGGRRWR